MAQNEHRAASGRSDAPVDVTVVFPALNEEATIRESSVEISRELRAAGLDYELLFVDDGSTDRTWDTVRELGLEDAHVKGLRHRRRAGKASALANGFVHARGDIIVMCDADMQFDPHDVVRVIQKVGEGFDAVLAEKVVRRDSLLERRIPSKFFNAFVRRMTGVQLHDMNTGLKAFRRGAALELVRYGYGELHRYFMVILALKGYTVAEVEVVGRERPAGKSKYGFERYLRGALDFLTVFFLSGYVERPLHLFGGMGVVAAVLGTLVIVGSLVAEGLGAAHADVALEIGTLLAVSAVQLIVVGLIAEMLHAAEHGSLPHAEVAEVVGVERRHGAPADLGVHVERRRGLRETGVPDQDRAGAGL